MTPLEFLKHIWPAQPDPKNPAHWYCIAHPVASGAYEHRVFPTIEEAAAHVEAVKETKDTFFTVHVLEKDRVWDPEKQKWTYRKQTNMLACKDLFFDLDVDADPAKGKYTSLEEAVRGLKQFINETELSRPMMVTSGGGLHVHWVLADALPTKEWRALAEKMKALGKAHGLKYDPVRTTDSASVLRVPGTFNFKKEQRRPVSCGGLIEELPNEAFIADIDAAIERKGVKVEAPRAPAAHVPMIAVPEGLTANIDEKKYEPFTVAEAVGACAQLQRLARTQGNMSEPEWFHSLGILGFATDQWTPDEIAQNWSKGHPEYDPAKTSAKLQQVFSQQKGLTTCAVMREKCGPANEHLCESCPFYKKVNSVAGAIKILKPTAEPVIVKQVIDCHEVVLEQPELPYGYKTPEGTTLIQKQMVNEKTEEVYYVTILENLLYPIHVSTSRALGKTHYIWCYHPPQGEPFTFSMDASELGDDRQLRNVLQNMNVVIVEDKTFKLVRQFMSAYINDLLKRKPPAPTVNHLGWINDHQNFVLPQGIIKPDGSMGPVSLGKHAKVAENYVKRAGTLADQRRLMEFWKDPAYIPHQVFILAGLASPLFFATGHAGVIFNAHSPISGAAKSTAIKTAASFYGSPEHFVMSAMDRSSTPLRRYQKLFMHASLPFILDEVTVQDHTEIRNIALEISQPQYREMMDRNGNPKPNPFEGMLRSNIMITTANQSFHNTLSRFAVAGVAATMRVFEIELRRQTVHTEDEGQAFLWELNQHYGHIGYAFLQHIVPNIGYHVARVQQMSRDLNREANMTQDMRYWNGGLSCVLVAGEIARELNLLPFDVPAIRRFLVNTQIPFLREVVTETGKLHSPLTILTDFIEQNDNKILRTWGMPQDENAVGDMKAVHSDVAGHYEVHRGFLYILRATFREYCERRGVAMSDVLSRLFHDRIVVNKDKLFMLGKGIRYYEKSQSHCMQVNMQHPALGGVSGLKSVPGPATAAVVPLRGVAQP